MGSRDAGHFSIPTSEFKMRRYRILCPVADTPYWRDSRPNKILGGNVMDWNYGDLLDAVAEAVPQDAPLFIHGERRISWGQSSRRMNNLAQRFIAGGAK